MFEEIQEPLVVGVQPLHETPRCTCKQKARYTEFSAPHEESQMERLENILDSPIKGKDVCHEIRDFFDLVDMATLVEKRVNESLAANELKRRSIPQVSNPSKRIVVGDSSQPSEKRNFSPTLRNQKRHCHECRKPQRKKIPLCDTCGKPHTGECRMASSTCFKCGKFGYY
jgi:hypothetical protein